jgi:hypothetical protein
MLRKRPERMFEKDWARCGTSPASGNPVNPANPAFVSLAVVVVVVVVVVGPVADLEQASNDP